MPNTKSTSALSSAKAVQRSLRSDRPILAELSGGMDSSSIVCMADTVIARGAAETPRLDTISWFDDSDDQTGRSTNSISPKSKKSVAASAATSILAR